MVTSRLKCRINSAWLVELPQVTVTAEGPTRVVTVTDLNRHIELSVNSSHNQGAHIAILTAQRTPRPGPTILLPAAAVGYALLMLSKAGFTPCENSPILCCSVFPLRSLRFQFKDIAA